jgi:hypothetical protein
MLEVLQESVGVVNRGPVLNHSIVALIEQVDRIGQRKVLVVIVEVDY